MKLNLYKSLISSLLAILLICMTGCVSQKDESLDSAQTSQNTTSVLSESPESQVSESSSVKQTSKKQTTTTSKKIISSSSKNKSSKNSTTSKKSETNTSSGNTVVSIPEKPALSYAELEKKANEFARKNVGVATYINDETFYALDGNFYIVPIEFLNSIPNYNYLYRVKAEDEKEYVASIDLCQAKDYIYASEVLKAIKRDLKIIEEFAGIKPTSFVFKNVKDNKSFKKLSDIPEDYFKTFSRGAHSAIPKLTVYFEDGNKNNPHKLIAKFHCYTSDRTNANSNRIYNYSINLYINYNRDIIMTEYWQNH